MMCAPLRSSSAALAAFLLLTGVTSAQRGRGAAPPPEGPPTAIRLDVIEGSKAGYRVREQLAGINFPNDAVGSTGDIKGALVLNADGAIDGAQSKITVDLRTLKSDQDMRDGYLRGERGLNTAKFPTAEFVPKRAAGHRPRRAGRDQGCRGRCPQVNRRKPGSSSWAT